MREQWGSAATANAQNRIAKGDVAALDLASGVRFAARKWQYAPRQNEQTMAPSPAVRLLSSLGGMALALVVAGTNDFCHAQGKLDALYTISMARITVGKGAWTADIGTEQYATSASGSASGILSVLVSGEGAIASQGRIKDGRLIPTSFNSHLVREDETAELRMTLDGGNVTEVLAQTLPSDHDRLPLTETHRKGVLDPLTALLITVEGNGDVLSPEACRRTLPIFDGRRRYNLALAFKRLDKVKAEKGYQGNVVVCSMAFQPIAGHRASSLLVKYLSQSRGMEIWLAPIPGARVLAPFRLSVENLVGDLVMQASRF